MEKRRVVITGLGTVNPLGNNTADSWAAAKAGKCGIGPITQFDTTDFKCKLAGEVKGFDPETIVDKKEARKMARFTVLALAAAAEAVADSGLDTEAEAKQIGVILSSGIGGLPTIEEQHTRGEEKGMEKVSPYFVPMSIANMAAAQVAIRFGLKGMCTCPVTACAGGTNAVGDAFHRIRDGYETAMVCGGAESCISPLGIGGFTSMKALSTATDPDAASLPFDARRGGFVMGEGSGVLVLEELEHARARGAHIYAEVVGYGANCDAYHFTAPAPGGAGAIDCMALTLADAGIAPEQVDHINAHGTVNIFGNGFNFFFQAQFFAVQKFKIGSAACCQRHNFFRQFNAAFAAFGKYFRKRNVYAVCGAVAADSFQFFRCILCKGVNGNNQRQTVLFNVFDMLFKVDNAAFYSFHIRSSKVCFRHAAVHFKRAYGCNQHNRIRF